jgi:hypothetical protein
MKNSRKGDGIFCGQIITRERIVFVERWGLYRATFYRGGGEFCQGKLTLGKILPGKNSVPELKNGGKNSVPSGFGRVQRKFGAKRRRNFWLIF